jgi:serine/threonine protein kinase
MYAIHTTGIVHEYLKPSNVLLMKGTHHPMITDFWSSQFQSTGCIAGSPSDDPAYAAPELSLEQQHPMKADVFSFGVILFEVVTGTPAFNPQFKGLQLARKIADQKYRPEIPPSVQAFVGDLIPKCWNADPEKRPTFPEIFTTLRNNRFQILPRVDEAKVQTFCALLTSDN